MIITFTCGEVNVINHFAITYYMQESRGGRNVVDPGRVASGAGPGGPSRPEGVDNCHVGLVARKPQPFAVEVLHLWLGRPDGSGGDVPDVGVGVDEEPGC